MKKRDVLQNNHSAIPHVLNDYLFIFKKYRVKYNQFTLNRRIFYNKKSLIIYG